MKNRAAKSHIVKIRIKNYTVAKRHASFKFIAALGVQQHLLTQKKEKANKKRQKHNKEDKTQTINKQTSSMYIH